MILGMIIMKSDEASFSPTCSAALGQDRRAEKKATAGGTSTPSATAAPRQQDRQAAGRDEIVGGTVLGEKAVS